MGEKIAELYVDLDLQSDKLDKKIDKSKSKFKSFGSNIKNFGKGLLGVGAVATGVGAALLKIGDDFDKANRKIIVGTGATGATLKQLKTDFDNVFKNVPDDAGKVADVLATLNTATGETGKTLEDLTTSVLNASRVLGEDATANAAKFGQVLNQFSVPAEKGTQLLDDLFRITQDYGVSLGDITGQLKVYGSVMKNAGFSVQETALLMGRMNKAGLNWSRVAPGLNKAFRDMAKEGINARDGLSAAINEIKNAKTDTEALTKATALFGAEGAQRMMRAIRDGVFTLKDLEKTLGKNTGLIGKTEKQTRTLGEEFDIVKNQLLLMLKPFAGDFLYALKKAIPYIKDFFEHLRTAIKWIVTFGKAAYDLSIKIKKYWDDITTSTRLLLMGVKTYLVDKFQSIVNKVKGLIDDVKGFFFGLYDSVVGHSYIPDMIKRIFEEMGPGLKKALVDNTAENTQAAAEEFVKLKTSVEKTTGETNQIVQSTFDDMKRGVGRAFADMVVDGDDFGESMKDLFKDLAKNIIAKLIEIGIEWTATKLLLEAGINAGPISAGGLGLGAVGGGLAGGAIGYGASQIAQQLGLESTGTGATIGGAIGGFVAGPGGALVGAAAGETVEQVKNEYGTGAAIGATIGLVGGPIGVAIGGATGKAIDDFGSSIGLWAHGAIVTKPTMGVVGEGGEPEAVLPISKLQEFVDQGSGKQTIIINLDGRQIAYAVSKNMPEVLHVNGVSF